MNSATEAQKNQSRTLRLGTRGSPLAIAQSRLVKQELEDDHPSVTVELVPITTRGDKDLKTALSNVKDADFFNAELDEALLNGEIDFCVHSLKDLPLQRPEGISIAAIPARENPRDVVLFRSDVVNKIEAGEALIIGTCSQRRVAGIKRFLPKALPHDKAEAVIETADVRGAIDQRLLRLQDNAEDQLDGIVLAIAGLNRLFKDADGRKIMQPLLQNLRWMVLPISEFPCTPGQAALAIECRSDDKDTRLLLGSLVDEDSAKAAMTERALLSELAEDERSGYSATAITHPNLNVLLWSNSVNNEDVKLHWLAPVAPGNHRAWDETLPEDYRSRRPLPVSDSLEQAPAIFIAHSNAFISAGQLDLKARLWTSGIKSWQKLASYGLWIEGCAENLGFEFVKSQLATEVLQLPALEEWTALTHEGAASTWEESGIGHVVATYRVDTAEQIDPELEERIHACTHYYWGSYSAYEAIGAFVPDHAHHACGPGKTLEQLKANGIWTVDVFPSRKEWRRWLKGNK